MSRDFLEVPVYQFADHPRFFEPQRLGEAEILHARLGVDEPEIIGGDVC
ncbi:MAG: hypothetical protein HZA68_13025 [Rhodovulum sp.]|nr:hypothetical protein [Rhodovulum sp.]